MKPFVAIVILQAALGFLTSRPAHAQITPIKPPAVPLITRSPYVSTWLANKSAIAPGTWPTFWTGQVKAISGIAHIDGTAYTFFGNPQGIPKTMTQTSLDITATQSKFQFTGGGVLVSVDFLSPIEAHDIKRLSMPLSYIDARAQSADGSPHKVSLYFDISGEWASGNPGTLIKWSPSSITLSPGRSLAAWHVSPCFPAPLNEIGDYPSWGEAVFGSEWAAGVTKQSGAADDVRRQFVEHGKLTNGNDTDQPRPINDNWPVVAFAKDVGIVYGQSPAANRRVGSQSSSPPFRLLLGHVEDPAVSYLGKAVPPLWKSYWPSERGMLAFAFNDIATAFTRAQAFDATVSGVAGLKGGDHYAALTALAMRQAFAGTELVGTTKDPWLFLKEISSDGNVSTVDVVYPACPAFLWANPELLRLMLEPLIAYAESGHWPEKFAPHDLGAAFPNASGHNNGGGENMPVEESANMLIMSDAYMRATQDKSSASRYARAHYKLFKRWTDYLLTVPPGVKYCNALDPQYQNQTDDFTGQIAHSVNLALKGIIAVGAMGQIAAAAGQSVDAKHYSDQAQSMIAQWVTLSQNSDSTHLLLQYREPANKYSGDTMSEPDTAWGLAYNMFADKLLGTNLIPKNVLAEQAAFYKTKETADGITLDYRNPYTKLDWELWAAAGAGDPPLRQDIIDETFNWANTTACATPMPDWYWLTTPQTGFSARPVLGGIFAILAAK